MWSTESAIIASPLASHAISPIPTLDAIPAMQRGTLATLRAFAFAIPAITIVKHLTFVLRAFLALHAVKKEYAMTVILLFTLCSTLSLIPANALLAFAQTTSTERPHSTQLFLVFPALKTVSTALTLLSA